MEAGDILRLSSGALRGNPLRSVLSMLGIAIGVAAVVLLTSLGEGARRYAFVAGYLPPEHVSCVDRSWLDWFRFGGDDGRPRPEEEDTEQ